MTCALDDVVRPLVRRALDDPETLRWLAAALSPYLRPAVPTPAPFALTVTQTRDPGMPTTFHVIAALKPVPADDPNNIASQELVVTVDGAAMPVQTPPLDATTVDLGTFALGAKVEAALAYTDAAGNRSEPRVESVVVSDTVAPAQPGEFGLSVTQVGG